MHRIAQIAFLGLLLVSSPMEIALAQEDSEIPRVPGAPDFTEVRSLEAARELSKTGQLVPVLLFPADVGGEQVPSNIVYLPPEAAKAKRLIDGTIVRFVADGVIDQMNVSPVYRGDSFVPARIVIEAWHSEKEGKFNPAIEVW